MEVRKEWPDESSVYKWTPIEAVELSASYVQPLIEVHVAESIKPTGTVELVSAETIIGVNG